MANQTSTSSLRRRLTWTLATAGTIGVISLSLIVVFHPSARETLEAKRDRSAPAAEEKSAANGPTITSNARQDALTLGQPPDAAAAIVSVQNSAASGSNAARRAKPAGNFHSVSFAYRVTLQGTPWTQWESLAEVVPEAEWGALLYQRGRFLVIPISLLGLDPRPEALDHALLARLGIAYPSQQLDEFKTIEVGPAVGHAFQFSRDVEGAANVYRIWVLRRGDFAYLAAAWMDVSPDKGGSADPNPGELSAVLGAISFDPRLPAQIDPARFKEIQRRTHGALFNDLGLFAFNSRDYAGAVESFRRSFELQPNDAAVLQNLLDAHVELKQYAAALAVLEPALARFPNEPDLRACRAFLLSEMGKTNAALIEYSALFNSDYHAEGPFTRYVSLLTSNGQTKEALDAVERFLASHDSFALERMQAELFRQLGQPERAIGILSRLQVSRPFNAEIAYDLVEAHQSVERYQESLGICRELLEHRYDTAHTYLLMARAEFALKRFAGARKSLQEALKREPTNKEAAELLGLVSPMLADENSTK